MLDTATLTTDVDTLTLAQQSPRRGILVPSSSTGAWLWKAPRSQETATTIEAWPDQPPHIVILDRRSFVFTEHVMDAWLERVRDVMETCILFEANDYSDATTELSSGPSSSAVTAALDGIMAAADHEEFEVGMCSEFEAGLRRFVGEYGERAVSALHSRLQRTTKSDVICEALTSLGSMRHGATRDARLAMLATFLGHRDAAIRDTAMRGLVDIQDVRARRPLQAARDAETNRLLRRRFDRALALMA
ncbi:MAG: HEAT repeat domain-containing protein [Gemmatimonadales bacterium]